MAKGTRSVEITLDDNTGVSSAPGSVKTRLTDVENLTKAILWVGIISVVGVVITCCALVIDQMHFNNQTYNEQSDVRDLQIKELSTRVDRLTEELRDESK